jgi:hypothetical protein
LGKAAYDVFGPADTNGKVFNAVDGALKFLGLS